MPSDDTTTLSPLDAKRFAGAAFGGLLEIGDRRWLRLTKRIDAGDYPGAARVAESVFDGGIRDARLLGYYLYGCFDAERLEGLADVLETLASALKSSADSSEPGASGPQAALHDATQWLLAHLSRRLGHVAPGDALVSPATLPPEDAERVTQAVHELRAQIRECWPGAPAESSIERLACWWEDSRRAARENDPAPGPEAQEQTDETEPRPVGTHAPPKPAAPPSASRTPGAPAWSDLLERLETFERLAAREDWLRAAILALDIERRLKEFDPRQYFPHLFTPFYLDRSRHGDSIERAAVQCAEGTRRALEELCLLDLRAFGAPEASPEGLEAGAEAADDA